MAHIFEMLDGRLREVKGLEATELGACAAPHCVPAPFWALGGVVYHKALLEAWREAGA